MDKVLDERITKGEKINLSDGKFIERMLTIKQINSGNASKAPFYRHLVPLGQERLDALRYVITVLFGISLSTLMLSPGSHQVMVFVQSEVTFMSFHEFRS